MWCFQTERFMLEHVVHILPQQHTAEAANNSQGLECLSVSLRLYVCRLCVCGSVCLSVSVSLCVSVCLCVCSLIRTNAGSLIFRLQSRPHEPQTFTRLNALRREVVNKRYFPERFGWHPFGDPFERKRDHEEQKRRDAPPRPNGAGLPPGSYLTSCKGCASGGGSFRVFFRCVTVRPPPHISLWRTRLGLANIADTHTHTRVRRRRRR